MVWMVRDNGKVDGGREAENVGGMRARQKAEERSKSAHYPATRSLRPARSAGIQNECLPCGMKHGRCYSLVAQALAFSNFSLLIQTFFSQSLPIWTNASRAASLSSALKAMLAKRLLLRLETP